MKFFVFLSLLLGWAQPAIAQDLQVMPLKLDKAMANPENQFSGLQLHNGNLILMSESRVQEQAEAKLYAIDIKHWKQVPDSNVVLHGNEIPITGLNIIAGKISGYEGLEAFAITSNSDVYFAVETHTEEDNCYLLRGQFALDAVMLDTGFLLHLPKPVLPGGKHVFNAGFEAIGINGGNLYCFYEYNEFPGQSYAYRISLAALRGGHPQLVIVPLSRSVPFRITDVGNAGSGIFIGVNYFYSGNTDTIYRPAAIDSVNNNLVKKNGTLQNYARLIKLVVAEKQVSWQAAGEIPAPYSQYNMEGIAPWQQGYFLINDKYGPSRPYHSQLLYVY